MKKTYKLLIALALLSTAIIYKIISFQNAKIEGKYHCETLDYINILELNTNGSYIHEIRNKKLNTSTKRIGKWEIEKGEIYTNFLVLYKFSMNDIIEENGPAEITAFSLGRNIINSEFYIEVGEGLSMEKFD